MAYRVISLLTKSPDPPSKSTNSRFRLSVWGLGLRVCAGCLHLSGVGGQAQL